MKHYLIDSENVGDFWIPLLELPADQAELIVFYTKNSPHMSYDSLIKLKESDRIVTFIKCYEGTNALDFQLCSELGFLIAGNPGDEFIIVTNDTGYDAAVKYWRRKEYSVKRIAGKDSRTGSRRRGTPARFDVAAEVSAILHKLVKMPDHEESEAEEEQNEAEERTEIRSEISGYAEPDPEDEYEEEPDAEDEADFAQEDDEENDPDQENGGDASEVTEEDADEIYEDDQEDLSEEDEDAEEKDTEEDTEEEDPEEEPEAENEDENAEADGLYVSGGQEPEEASEPEETQTGGSEDAGSEDSRTEENGSAEGPVSRDPDASETVSGADPEEEEAKEFVPDQEEVTAIVNCIGMENLAELHNQLIQFYGDDGKDVYQALKSGALTIEKKDWDKEEKFLYYCALIFRHSDEPADAVTEEKISEFAAFLLGAENKRKNLNSLRYALLKHYGKEKGRRYYFMLKPYVKALNQM